MIKRNYENHNKILIVSIARVSSTYLLDILSQPYTDHVRIGEPFNPLGAGYGSDWKSLDKLVVKTHVSQLLNEYPDPNELTSMFDYVVKLKRKNLFEQVTSLARVRITNAPNDETPNGEHYKPCIIDRDTFVSVHRYITNQYIEMNKMLCNDVIYYEYLNHEISADLKEWNIDYQDSSKYVHDYTRKLPDKSQTIENYEECKIWWHELTGDIVR